MNSTSVTPKFGLVCITASKQVRYRTVTRKRLLQLSEFEQEEILRNLYGENLQRLNQAIDFCLATEINLYRLTSNLFPFADTELGERIVKDLMKNFFKRVNGRYRLASVWSCIPINSLSSVLIVLKSSPIASKFSKCTR